MRKLTKKSVKKPSKKSVKNPSKKSVKKFNIKNEFNNIIIKNTTNSKMEFQLTQEDKNIIREYFPSKNEDSIQCFSKLLIRDLSLKMKPIITFDNIQNNSYINYEEDCSKKNMGLHIGQRKLLLNEIQFLTLCNKVKNNPKYCIYAGSAPGNKTYLLSQLFPDVKFILIDPNIFNLLIYESNNITKNHRNVKNPNIIHLYSGYQYSGNKYNDNLENKKITSLPKLQQNKLINFIIESDYKIFIIEDYMSNEFAELFKLLPVCSFISDIRSNVKLHSYPSDFDIVWNMTMMFNWINILEPEVSVFKFRTPFYNDGILDFNQFKHIFGDTFEVCKKFGIDFIENYNKKIFKVVKSVLYLQPWKGPTSTEMRSVIYKNDIITKNFIDCDIKNIENTLFYYNKISRLLYHTNNNADRKIHFCNCNDCAIENDIWVNYFKLNIDQSVIKTVHDAVIITDLVTQRTLSSSHNNNIWKPLQNLQQFKEMYNRQNKSSSYKSKLNEKGNKGM